MVARFSSQAVQQLVRGALPAEVALRDLGEHRLRDLLESERVWQVLAPGLAADFPPRGTLEQHTTNFPVQLTPLIGREHEMVVLGKLLREPTVRLVTLTGPGGTGKTRLALAVAKQLLPEFRDGAVFVDLAPVRDPEYVLSEVATVLGLREAAGRPLRDVIRSYLADRDLLLILDNFEHLLVAAPVVSESLAAGPGVRVLVTSRASLRLRGEREYPVPTFPLPSDTDVSDPALLVTNEAVAFFVDRRAPSVRISCSRPSMRRRWPRSATASMGCHSLLNWRPRGSKSSPQQPCSHASMPDCRC